MRSGLSSVWVVVGIIGAFLIGMAVSVLILDQKFTTEQKLYISGVAAGSKFLQTKTEVEMYRPNVPEDSILRNPHQKCIQLFYPQSGLELAGCLDTIDGDEWRVP